MSLFDQLFPRRGSLASSQILEAAVKPNQSSQGGNDVTDTTRFPSSTFKIERIGTVSATIAINTAAVTVTQTLTPVLPDIVGNYIISAFVDDPNGVITANTPWASGGQLADTATLKIRILRSFAQAAAATQGTSATATITAGKLTDVSGMALTPIPNPTSVSDPHGQATFPGAFDHQHDLVAHTAVVNVTNPSHTHTLTTTQAAVTVNVDWMIIHK